MEQVGKGRRDILRETGFLAVNQKRIRQKVGQSHILNLRKVQIGEPRMGGAGDMLNLILAIGSTLKLQSHQRRAALCPKNKKPQL